MDNRSHSIRPAFWIATLIASLLTMSGCGDLLKQPYPAKSFFSIEPGAPDEPSTRPSFDMGASSRSAAATEPAHLSSLAIRPIRVIPPYDGLAFVYRDGPSQYNTDYYVNWIASPSALLTAGLTEWLDRNGPVPVVLNASSIRPDLVLDGEVTSLVIDRIDRAHPRAILDARFFLSRQTNSTSSVVSDTSYTVELPVTSDDAAGYAAAWGKAFRQLLTRLTQDLKTATLSSRNPS